MNRSCTGTLKVPGATLHYEVCGTGPVLLLIPGGPADADGFAPIRDALSDRYTVVTYDPRGLSRSPFDGGPQDTTVQTFADDAHQLLAAIGTEPTYVFGDSSGALVGLELVSQHPEQVRVLVAHEPPLTRLLDDADEHVRFGREVYDTYRSEGIGPALEKFAAGAGLDSPAAIPGSVANPKHSPVVCTRCSVPTCGHERLITPRGRYRRRVAPDPAGNIAGRTKEIYVR
jgi:pimeloyl-ACP methyl ester carboxylesterase